jgi:hypothetical protein
MLALAELSDTLREAPVLRHYEGMNFEEMSRVLGTPASTLNALRRRSPDCGRVCNNWDGLARQYRCCESVRERLPELLYGGLLTGSAPRSNGTSPTAPLLSANAPPWSRWPTASTPCRRPRPASICRLYRAWPAPCSSGTAMAIPAAGVGMAAAMLLVLFGMRLELRFEGHHLVLPACRPRACPEPVPPVIVRQEVQPGVSARVQLLKG